MARTGNPSAKVQKLEANVKKLKAKIDALTKKINADSTNNKKKVVEIKEQLTKKIKEAEVKGFEKGLSEALKLQQARNKAIEAAAAKFDKAWDKKSKKTAKPKKVVKKKAVKKSPAKKAEAKA